MKALSARLARLEQQRPPPIVAHEGPNLEVFKEELRRVLEQPDRRKLLPAREQLALLVEDHAKRLKARQLPDDNRGCVPGLDVFADRMHAFQVADLRARIEAEASAERSRGP